MSLSTGVENGVRLKKSKKSNPINDLLLKKQLSEALSLINHQPELLRQPDAKGRLPAHIAASLKQTSVFNVMLEKGADPFAPDADGFSAYYHASIQGSREICDLCVGFFRDDTWLSLETNIPTFEEQLLRAGLHPYFIKPIKTTPTADDSQILAQENDMNELYHLLQQLFQNGEAPAYQAKDRTLKTKDLAKDKSFTLVEPCFIQQIAAGLVDSKVLPHNIVEILTQLYPSLSKNQKLACTYLLKEFIESDVEREWIETPSFRQQMESFIQGMDTKMLSHMAIKTALEKFYKSKVRKEYDASEEALAFDLTKAFHHLMVRLTPSHFRGEMLAAKNSQRNPVFSAISDLTNNISHFVSIEVLSAKSIKERVRLVKYFLDVIEICLKQGIHQNNEKLIYNFAAAAAIFNGLAITQVTRLTKTWEQIDKDKLYSQRFEEYKLLFMPGAFTALRKEITQHPDCIPLVALFGAEKDKNAEAPLMNALELNGDANRRFANHQAYLRKQSQWESMPYKTNILEKFEKMYHTDNYVWALSYDVNPPKVINVDSNPDLDQLLKLLGEMKMLNAPLAVIKNKNMLTGKEAFEALKRYLDKKFPKRVTLFEGNTELQAPVSMASSSEKFSDDAQKRQAVIDLAKTVILDFDQLLQKPQIEDITQRLGAVSLKETQKRASSSAAAVDDDAPTRKRSKTLVTQFPSSDATPRRGSFSKEQKLEMLTKGVPRDTRTALFPSSKEVQEATSSPVLTLAPTFAPMASISVATSSQEGSLSKVTVDESKKEKKAHQRHQSEVASSPRKK